jgi:hypothetical protein
MTDSTVGSAKLTKRLDARLAPTSIGRTSRRKAVHVLHDGTGAAGLARLLRPGAAWARGAVRWAGWSSLHGDSAVHYKIGKAAEGAR